MTVLTGSLAWIGICSLYTFFRMGWDKRKANQKEWRTSEKHFFIAAAIGGSLGVLLGMQVWRHKTQKWAFKLPVYSIVTLQLILLYLYWFVYQ
ncbi:MAG: Unknown protein [uncultured Aureispira sp.]|uniref:DUF1294 domain-containing protein n=1 Tax=uncultured Aureispira sp. TaxID=1331704 RepID=A0A6S6RUM5_9BACT|nr:MAG: Unknown protein [uncultured Aureispira sp.]